MTLQGKTVLIPGASRIIGRAIAEQFAQEGATLILPVFDWPESISEMKEEFTKKGYSYHCLDADLRNREDVKALFQYIKEKSGRLDYLINNIERGGMPVVHGSYDHPHNKDQWDLEVDTTLKAKWLLYHYCKPLLQQGESGSVVNISSIAGLEGRYGPAALFFNDAYSAANRAVDWLTRQWAREGRSQYRVNGLVLGLIEGRHGEHTMGWSLLNNGQKEELFEHTLLGRTGKAQEVADTVYFLAVKASYMTGSIITMDGGYSLGADRVPPMPPGIL